MSSSEGIPSLTPNQINALVVLMVEARELTNSELRDLAGFALTGSDNAALVKHGLVETDRSHRPFSHQLSEEGWAVVRRLHTVPPPKRGGSASRSLFTLLASLHRSLDRQGISHADFFTGTAVAPTSAEPPTSAAPPVSGDAVDTPAADPEALIRAAYRELAAAPGDWVGLADLRDRLAGQERASVDAALRSLVRREGVRIIPVANTKSLTPRDRAAAVRIGDEDNHALSIGPA